MNTVISFEQLVQDFDSLFRRRVFRLETLDWYDAPNEHEPYARFLAGEPADWAWREPWKRIVRDIRASGRTMSRVHVVTEPPGDYMRFELLRVYPANTEAGEYVGIISRDKGHEIGILGAGDFWLFDDKLAAILAYDAEGRVERVELDDRPRTLMHLRSIEHDALKTARPLPFYVAQHNITEERTHA